MYLFTGVIRLGNAQIWTKCVVEGKSLQEECMTNCHMVAKMTPLHIKVSCMVNFPEVLKADKMLRAFSKLKDTPSAVISFSK